MLVKFQQTFFKNMSIPLEIILCILENIVQSYYNEYLLAKIGSDTPEDGLDFAEKNKKF